MYKQESHEYADRVATKGSVMHFAIRLGFLPLNELQAEKILENIIKVINRTQALASFQTFTYE